MSGISRDFSAEQPDTNFLTTKGMKKFGKAESRTS